MIAKAISGAAPVSMCPHSAALAMELLVGHSDVDFPANIVMHAVLPWSVLLCLPLHARPCRSWAGSARGNRERGTHTGSPASVSSASVEHAPVGSSVVRSVAAEDMWRKVTVDPAGFRASCPSSLGWLRTSCEKQQGIGDSNTIISTRREQLESSSIKQSAG